MPIKKGLVTFAFLVTALFAAAQAPVTDTAKKDTTKTTAKIATLPADSRQIKPYKEVIRAGYVTKQGLFTVHQYKDSVYFEIPDSILHRDIMTVNRLEKAPAGSAMFAGEELKERVIQFEKNKDSTITIRYNLLVNRADVKDDIYKAVERSNYNPVAYTFPIKAISNDSSSYVVDATPFLTGNTFINEIGEGQLFREASYSSFKIAKVTSIHVYPINVEISTTKDLQSKSGTPPEPLSVMTHISFVALPRIPMQQRLFDPRVGYFTEDFNQFADNQQKVEKRQVIVRWRLEPGAKDVARWKRGELVEPAQPIVIYIDPATPRQWRKYLIQGINDWQKAFEQAGFKNAIIGKEWPENDTTMQLDDVRYSVLHYFPSATANAYGPHVNDPRSGEIIQTRIGWYHNVMSLLHDWYQVQAGATDPAARKAKFSEELMGQLIRFVSSHEVGHTLGLRHNFGSSSRTPVDSLRSLTYLKQHGHTASIMDYARFNYVAQPEDHIPQEYLFPRIGEYDRWAIEWGYKASFAKDVDEDTRIVRKWISDRLAKNTRLWFGDGETQKTDARNQTEDLGDNAMKASTYGIKNLQRILPRLPEWTYEEGGVQQNLAEMYQNVKNQYTRYLDHVLLNIAGIHKTLRPDGDTMKVYEIVPAAMQLEAVEFFNQQLFTAPLWLKNPVVSANAEEPANPDFIEDMQVRGLNSLLDVSRLNKISANRNRFGEKALQLNDYVTAVHQGIWKGLKEKKVTIDNYSRTLQKAYFANLMAILLAKTPEMSETDASSIMKADILLLEQEIKTAIPNTSDAMSRIHLEDLQNRISNLLNAKNAL
ncbi:protein of unknown function [Chitinophaga eiseniae]|uniref:Zinc-dependent metalloprotease n=1 Tax=Chitinophaga eiseniae TaxID=634771 RepID=A0A1T4SMR7_9BACT|nr:zinc-dependent metalloprotease [Chitinophaga eiseniae]SKA29487.1 protein of unknown function [Chitinophaga eiseniae]